LLDPSSSPPEGLSTVRKRFPIDSILPAAFFILALLISCHDIQGSGSLFPDGPRYANAGAMIHDWLKSGDLLHPLRFSEANYARYPGFSLPYHPPVYPGLLGLFFLVTGVSFAAARVFIGLCLGASGWLFYAILRKFGTSRLAAAGCTVLLMTSPEVVLWSRDTMSELPALMFILAGSLFFVNWVRTERPQDSWAAFGLAALAFLSRVTTCAVLPAWFLYALVAGDWRRLFSAHVVLAAVLYLAVGAGYVKFASQYSKYETTQNPSLGATSRVSWENVSYYPVHLPGMVGWGTLAAALAGAVCAARLGRRCPQGYFWLGWLGCYYAFQLLLATNYPRYFFFALPSLFGLAACLFDPQLSRPVRRWLAPAALGAGLVTNVALGCQVPRGVVGYEAVARRLSALDQPGNVLLASPQFQDLIFRVRGLEQRPRRMLRSDRTLAIRLSPYTGVSPKILVHTRADVLEILRRGRVRYLVSSAPVDPQRDDRSQEMILAHEVASTSPDLFTLVGEGPLLTEFGKRGDGYTYHIYIWKNRGEIPAGPSEIPVMVPTAGLEIH
jgi:hypothetical protein